MKKENIFSDSIIDKDKKVDYPALTHVTEVSVLAEKSIYEEAGERYTFVLLIRAFKIILIGALYYFSMIVLEHIRAAAGVFSNDFELYSKIFGSSGNIILYSLILAAFILLLLINKRIFNRLFFTGLIMIPLYLGYEFTNNLQFNKEIFIPEFNIEAHIPYMAWTSPIYMSTNILCFLAVFIIPLGHFKKTLIGLTILCSFQILFWYLLPSQFYPRPSWEFLKETDKFFFYFRDCSGFNAFPSQHVSMTIFLIGMMQIEKKKFIKTLLWIWAALISLSVLTVKQHYLLDLIAGLVVGFSVIYLVNRFIVFKGEPIEKEVEEDIELSLPMELRN